MPSEPNDLPFDPRRLPDPSFRVPDLVNAVEGWRAWGIRKDAEPYGLPPKLWSVTYGEYYWTPRRAMEAHCTHGSRGLPGQRTKWERRSDSCELDGGPGVPGEHCTCGFYSAKTLEHLMSMRYHLYDADESGMFHVVGQVANWGKVIVGTQGWRAQFAYPVRLYLPYEAAHLGKALQAAYGVPVQLKNILDRQMTV